jgi:dephospho-CoA kinase
LIALGLTGGVGMGKSACARLLLDKRIPVIDTDELARQFVEPGQSALAEIRSVFGPEVIDSTGRLLRQELANRVFADPAARQQLEAILHPRIRRHWREQIELWRQDRLPLAVVVIPLLFETGAESDLDATLCVACSAATQRQRLLARGWSLEQIAQRCSAQWPAEDKMARADFVIWSEGSLEVHQAQLERVLARW